MVNKENQIYWIIGIAILAVLVLPRLDVGLFAIGETCVSNEPDTLEGYETICDWTIGGEGNTKCHLSQGKLTGNDLEIAWGIDTDVGEGDVIIMPKNEVDINPSFEDLVLVKEKTRLDIDIFSWDIPDFKKVFYFCNNKKAEYNTKPNVDYQKYYTITYYSDRNKCVYLRHPDYLDYPCDNTNSYFENNDIEECLPNTICTMFTEVWRCESTDVGTNGACRVAENIPIITKEDYMCLLYLDTQIEDKYFDTFYTCEEEPQSCTQDAKQCSDGSYVSRDPNNNCVFTPCPDEPTINGDTEKWYNDVLYTSGSGFEFKLWMLLLIIGGIGLIFISTRK